MPTYGRIALTTNGTLLDRDETAKLFGAGLNSLTFSIDGATKDVYEERRPGAVFEELVENVASAVEYARQSGRDDVWLCSNFVITQDNIEDVVPFVKLGSSLGLDILYFFRGRDYPSMRATQLSEERLSQVRHEALAVARERGIPIVFARASRRPDRQECCFMQSAYLWLTGEVLPCHRMEPPGKDWPARIFGNVRERPLLEIWQDPDFVEFRRMVLAGPPPKECRDCTFCDTVIF